MAEDRVRLNPRDLSRLEKASADIEETAGDAGGRAEKAQLAGERLLRVLEIAERLLPRIEQFAKTQFSANTTRELRRGVETTRGAVTAGAMTLAVTRNPLLAAAATALGGALGFTEQQRKQDAEKQRQRLGKRDIALDKRLATTRRDEQNRKDAIEAMRRRIQAGR